MSTSELNGAIEGDLAFLFQLSFISDQVNEGVRGGVLLDFLEPVDSVDEGLVSGDIVGEEDAVSTSVEDPGDTLEGLLTGGVPYLKLDNFILDGACERAELHSDGDLMLSLEFVILDSAHEATLTDTSVTNYNQLKQMILSGE